MTDDGFRGEGPPRAMLRRLPQPSSVLRNLALDHYVRQLATKAISAWCAVVDSRRSRRAVWVFCQQLYSQNLCSRVFLALKTESARCQNRRAHALERLQDLRDERLAWKLVAALDVWRIIAGRYAQSCQTSLAMNEDSMAHCGRLCLMRWRQHVGDMQPVYGRVAELGEAVLVRRMQSLLRRWSQEVCIQARVSQVQWTTRRQCGLVALEAWCLFVYKCRRAAAMRQFVLQQSSWKHLCAWFRISQAAQVHYRACTRRAFSTWLWALDMMRISMEVELAQNGGLVQRVFNALKKRMQVCYLGKYVAAQVSRQRLRRGICDWAQLWAASTVGARRTLAHAVGTWSSAVRRAKVIRTLIRRQRQAALRLPFKQLVAYKSWRSEKRRVQQHDADSLTLNLKSMRRQSAFRAWHRTCGARARAIGAAVDNLSGILLRQAVLGWKTLATDSRALWPVHFSKLRQGQAYPLDDADEDVSLAWISTSPRTCTTPRENPAVTRPYCTGFPSPHAPVPANLVDRRRSVATPPPRLPSQAADPLEPSQQPFYAGQSTVMPSDSVACTEPLNFTVMESERSFIQPAVRTLQSSAINAAEKTPAGCTCQQERSLMRFAVTVWNGVVLQSTVRVFRWWVWALWLGQLQARNLDTLRKAYVAWASVREPSQSAQPATRLPRGRIAWPEASGHARQLQVFLAWASFIERAAALRAAVGSTNRFEVEFLLGIFSAWIVQTYHGKRGRSRRHMHDLRQ